MLVPNDMEALFKRGPSFETGVDLVMVLQPSAPAAAAAKGAGPEGAGPAAQQPAQVSVVVEVVGRLQRAAMAANSVQVSCGVDVMSLEPKYIWMARFLQVGVEGRMAEFLHRVGIPYGGHTLWWV